MKVLDKTEQSDQASSRNEKPESCYRSALPKGSGPCLSCYTRWLASRRSKEVMAEDWDWLADQQESAPRICVRKNRLWRKTTCSSGRRPYWNDDDFDVVANDEVVGRIFKAGVSVARPWMWTLIFPHHEDRTPMHGYAVTREAAMAAFAKSLRLEYGVPRLTGQ
jgi:hypothetical protein